MNIFQKLMTALRGGAREVGESVVDAQGTRIFEQEIVDAKGKLDSARLELTNLMAKHTQAERDVQVTKAELKTQEGFVNEALDKGDEKLALDIASKVAELEGSLAEKKVAKDSFEAHVESLRGHMKRAEAQIGDYERQLSMVKSTESVQKASAAINDTFASTNSDLLSAKESLERIKAKQVHETDRLAASEALERELSGTDLKERMASAGIGNDGPDASSVLERIKSKRG